MIKEKGTPIVTTIAVFLFIKIYMVKKIRIKPSVKFEIITLRRFLIGFELSWKSSSFKSGFALKSENFMDEKVYLINKIGVLFISNYIQLYPITQKK